jgi:hypothetical protein
LLSCYLLPGSLLGDMWLVASCLRVATRRCLLTCCLLTDMLTCSTSSYPTRSPQCISYRQCLTCCLLTDMFTCSKCKTRRTTFYQKQTRSADEPMTVCFPRSPPLLAPSPFLPLSPSLSPYLVVGHDGGERRRAKVQEGEDAFAV